MRLVVMLAIAACRSTPATPATPAPPSPAESAPAALDMPRQIKTSHDFPVQATPVAYTLAPGVLSIDGRDIPLVGDAPFDRIARSIARVPSELRGLIHRIEVSPTPSANDALFAKKYGLPVLAGMSARADGEIAIYPHGLDELRDEDVFVRNLLHELGHTWSLQAWADPAAHRAWLAAIASDPHAPSLYAQKSFHDSGAADEDAAEATAVYFLVRDTPRYERYRAAMPARFGLLAARFAPAKVGASATAPLPASTSAVHAPSNNASAM